jgi:hypothetical protein
MKSFSWHLPLMGITVLGAGCGRSAAAPPAPPAASERTATAPPPPLLEAQLRVVDQFEAELAAESPSLLRMPCSLESLPALRRFLGETAPFLPTAEQGFDRPKLVEVLGQQWAASEKLQAALAKAPATCAYTADELDDIQHFVTMMLSLAKSEVLASAIEERADPQFQAPTPEEFFRAAFGGVGRDGVPRSEAERRMGEMMELVWMITESQAVRTMVEIAHPKFPQSRFGKMVAESVARMREKAPRVGEGAGDAKK